MSAARLRHAWRLATLLALAAAALFALGVRDIRPSGTAGSPISWLALAAGFALAEVFVAHLEFRRDAHTVSLSELALVIGLFSTSPTGVVAAQLLGGAVALALVRRQPLLKLVFNLAQFAVTTCLAVIVFHAYVDLGDGIGGADWVAALLAALAATFVGMAAVHAVIAATGGTPSKRSAGASLALGTGATVANTALALVAVELRTADPSAAWLLVIPGIGLLLASRAVVARQEEASRLRLLQEISELLVGADHVEAGLHAVLGRCATALRAGRVEVSLLGGAPTDAPNLLRTAVEGGIVVATMAPTPIDRGPVGATVKLGVGRIVHDPAELTAIGARFDTDPTGAGGGGRPATDALVVPLVGEGAAIGALLVADRQGDVATFDDDDLTLLATIAAQVVLWVENTRLSRSLQQLTELQAQLEHQALHDPLTGLANRALFSNHVGHALDRRDRRSRPLAVLFLDLDDFKAVNDTLGHAVGDSLLMAVADRLRHSLRPGDTAARFGGDEFAILLEEISGVDDAEVAARRLGEALRRPLLVDGWECRVEVSIGIATSKGGDGLSTPELLRNADLAMYFAKRLGKGRHEVFEPAMLEAAEARHEAGADLSRAVDHGELVVHHQPIVEVDTGRIVGVEALVRWDRPGVGLVDPATFITVAEETGLIGTLGELVLREACGRVASWQRSAPDLAVHVNVSARQLVLPSFAALVDDVLVQSGLQPGTLVLELPEHALLEGDGVRTTLESLRSLGVRVAVDDFGTGTSSLSNLRRFPISMVKVDRSFVQGLGNVAADDAVVAAVVAVGRSLGLTVVAEGVERAEQVERLRDLGCPVAQGHWFAPAGEAGAVDALVRRGRIPVDVVDLRTSSRVP